MHPKPTLQQQEDLVKDLFAKVEILTIEAAGNFLGDPRAATQHLHDACWDVVNTSCEAADKLDGDVRRDPLQRAQLFTILHHRAYKELRDMVERHRTAMDLFR